MARLVCILLGLFLLPAFPTNNDLKKAESDRTGDCHFNDRQIVQMSGAVVQKEDMARAGTNQSEEKKGCCCLLKDSGPPPVWDCSGYEAGTLGTKEQCKRDADQVPTKYKWHEGKCTDKD